MKKYLQNNSLGRNVRNAISSNNYKVPPSRSKRNDASPAPSINYSGFSSAQLESYYNRIHLKMIEFLSDFVIQCLSKDLCDVLGEASSAPPDEDELKKDSILGRNDEKIIKYLGDQQVCRFIKKLMKIYKALRVLERNKSSETP